MTGSRRPVLVEILDGQLRRGTTELDLVRTMNSVISESAPAMEYGTRSQVLLCMAGALRRVVARRRLTALLTGRLLMAWRLHEALWDVTEFAISIDNAPERDPDADYLRVQLLQLSLAGGAADTTGELARAARAMVRVASAGTTPVH